MFAHWLVLLFAGRPGIQPGPEVHEHLGLSSKCKQYGIATTAVGHGKFHEDWILVGRLFGYS